MHGPGHRDPAAHGNHVPLLLPGDAHGPADLQAGRGKQGQPVQGQCKSLPAGGELHPDGEEAPGAGSAPAALQEPEGDAGAALRGVDFQHAGLQHVARAAGSRLSVGAQDGEQGQQAHDGENDLLHVSPS